MALCLGFFWPTRHAARWRSVVDKFSQRAIAGAYRVRARTARIAWRSRNFILRDKPPSSTRDNSATMDPSDEAIAAIESRDPKEKLIYQDYADFFGVSRITLARRDQGRQGTRTAKIFN